MQRSLNWCAILVFLFCLHIRAADQPSIPEPTVKVGDPAPDFSLRDQSGKETKLSDFRGKKNVVLAFYVFAFTGGWEKEMQAYQRQLNTLEGADTQVLGVSMDSPFANKAWAQQIGVTFPLLSDLGGDVTRRYGVFNPKSKVARRVTYLIDKSGKVLEMQKDSEAIDPTAVITSCQRRRMKTK
jgi:peroxiredoxin